MPTEAERLFKQARNAEKERELDKKADKFCASMNSWKEKVVEKKGGAEPKVKKVLWVCFCVFPWTESMFWVSFPCFVKISMRPKNKWILIAVCTYTG